MNPFIPIKLKLIYETCLNKLISIFIIKPAFWSQFCPWLISSSSILSNILETNTMNCFQPKLRHLHANVFSSHQIKSLNYSFENVTTLRNTTVFSRLYVIPVVRDSLILSRNLSCIVKLLVMDQRNDIRTMLWTHSFHTDHVCIADKPR